MQIVTAAMNLTRAADGIATEVLSGSTTVGKALDGLFQKSLVAESHARQGIDTPAQLSERIGVIHSGLRELQTVTPDHEKLSLPLANAKLASDHVQSPEVAKHLESLTDSIDRIRGKVREPQRPIEFGPGEPRTEGHSPLQGMDDADVAEGVRRSPGSNANPNVDSLGNEPRDYSPGSAFDGSDSADLF